MTPPRTLGRYELRSEVGRGAAGIVHEGWDPVINRRVAIKTVQLPPAGEALEELARFSHEIQAAGRLAHPNIVAVYDGGETAGVAYIVMEFVDGGSLRSRLDACKRLALPDVLRVMEDVLAALQESHVHGIIHRDVKPGNILLTSGGRAKVADFGIARIASSTLTAVGAPIGTPYYMSPEQFMGQTVDARTDIYSAGVVLYQLLTGERPFEGGVTAIMHKVLHTRPPSPSKLSLDACPALDVVVERAIARRPQDRYGSAAEFAHALRAAAQLQMSHDKTVLARGPRPKPRVHMLAAFAALAAFGAAVAGWAFIVKAPKLPATTLVDSSTTGGPSGGDGAQPATGGSYYLRLAGSNTIGARLAPELVKEWLASKHATGIREEGRSDNGRPVPEYLITAVIDGRLVQVDVRAYGSSTAFTGLAAGTTDIGMTSRAIRDDESVALQSLGDMRRPSSEHVLALDGVAVIVPSGNPVGNLSFADLRRIFSGEARTWSAFGGADRSVKLYTLDDRSGTFDTFKDLVLKEKALGSSERFADSAELESAVARDPDGIGFVGVAHLKTARAVPVSDGNAIAMEPTRFTVKTESYPLTRRLYLYTAANPANPVVQDFVAFALSSAGQAAVRAARFVDLDLVPKSLPGPQEAAAVCRLSSQWVGDPQIYCRLRNSAEQLGTSFHFRTSSVELDARAKQDLRRVLERMEQLPGKKILLAGFADSLGAYADNCALSQSRARSIALELRTLGLPVAETIGFCDELPIRDNGTSDGREQNRRVDIFLR